MSVDDLIAGFKELQRLNPWARFVWNVEGSQRSVQLLEAMPHARTAFAVYATDAMEIIPLSPGNVGTTPAERFIAEAFLRVPEITEKSDKAPGSRTIQNAWKASWLLLQRVKGKSDSHSANSPIDPYIKRLQWRLDSMLHILQTVPVEVALGSIGHCEHEAAELIEQTGLADELELPPERRPVFRRVEADFDAGGFPNSIVYSFIGPNGHSCTAAFDWFWASSGSHSHDKSETERGTTIYEREVPGDRKPSQAFIQNLINCIRCWREYTDAPRLPKPGAINTTGIKEFTKAANSQEAPTDLIGLTKAASIVELETGDSCSDDSIRRRIKEGVLKSYEIGGVTKVSESAIRDAAFRVKKTAGRRAQSHRKCDAK